jgi:hypothetical protein
MEDRFKPIVVKAPTNLTDKELHDMIGTWKYGPHFIQFVENNPKPSRKRPITRNKRQHILR